MPAGIVMYGCAPFDPLPPVTPPCKHGVSGICIQCAAESQPFNPFQTMTPPLHPCPTCQRHIVTGTLCPWCTKPEQVDVAKLKAVLRKCLGLMRDLERTIGVSIPWIGEVEDALK